MSSGGRWQIVHHKLEVEGEESIGKIRAKRGNKGSNMGYFLVIYIPRNK